ncbi:30S ribosomal protein S2 [Planctomycetota bacterium]
MALIGVRDLLKAGVHYGHRTSRWNPKMEPFLFGKRNSVHIVDLAETVKGLYRAHKFLNQIAQDGEEVVFVGTKRPAQRLVYEESARCGMHFVRTRWIGGTFTNFSVVRSRLDRLIELEQMEESGSLGMYSKKMVSTLMRQKRKIARNLEGIRFMEKLPGAMVVIDPGHEEIAVREARKMGIPVIALTDTSCDPDPVDIVIPGNDDAMKAIRLILSMLADAILDGRGGDPGPTAALLMPAAPAEETVEEDPAAEKKEDEAEAEVSAEEEAPAPEKKVTKARKTASKTKKKEEE